MSTPPNKPVVLVVDDSEDTLEFIRMGVMAFEASFRVETASNGESAVEKMNVGHFDAVILDVALPDMTGSMVADIIRKSNKEIPMAFLTNYGGPVTHQNAKEFNAQFWFKPEVLNDFEVLVKRVCGLLGPGLCGESANEEEVEISETRRAVEPYRIPNFMAAIAAAKR